MPKKMQATPLYLWLLLAQGHAFSSSLTPFGWDRGTSTGTLPQQSAASFPRSTRPATHTSSRYSFICRSTLSQNEDLTSATAEEEDNDTYYDSDDDNDNVVDPTEIYEINLELAKLAHQCARGGRNSRTLALKAYDLLQDMDYPDSVAYNSVLKAFAKTSPTMLPPPPPKNTNMHESNNNQKVVWVTAAERAQHLLEEMCVIHEAQAKANQEWYVRHDKNAKRQQMSDEDIANGPPKIRVKPNTRSFTAVMDAWSRAGNVQETLEVLEALEARYLKSGKDIALQPNIFSYNTVLSAYAKSRGGQVAAEKAQQFLEDEMHATPDAVSYNAVLHAWARSGVPQAGQEAETILRNMSVAPNTRSFTTAIDAWSRSRTEESAMRAHGLLKELQELYNETEDDRLRPNCISYASVIHAYAVSKEPQKAQRAYALLQEMNEKGQSDPSVLPNIIAYNSVLNACATSSPLSSSNDDEMCLQTIVQSLYQELIEHDNKCSSDDEETTTKDDDASTSSSTSPRKRQSLTPDHFTFGTILKASANNIFWNDPTFVYKVFQEACKRGQVSLGVLKQLRYSVPMHVLCEFLPPKAYNPKTKRFSMSHIPEAWTRNVQERGGGDRKR